MRTTIRTRISLTAAVLGLGAWTTPLDQMTLQPESKLWVEGTSTVRSWKCQAPGLDVVVDAAPAAAKAVLTGERAVKSVRLAVTTDRMDCANGTMNDHMKKALKATEFPTIAFTLSTYELVKGADSVQATLNGELVLGGVKRPVVITAAVTPGTDGAMRVAGTYELHMKEYELKPPSLMFGTMKVGELVKVRFDLLLKP